MPRYKAMSERSDAEIVWVFLIMPPVMAFLLLSVTIGMVLRVGMPTTVSNWLGLIWCVIVLPAAGIGLPGVGWRELQKRKQQRKDAVYSAHDGR